MTLVRAIQKALTRFYKCHGKQLYIFEGQLIHFLRAVQILVTFYVITFTLLQQYQSNYIFQKVLSCLSKQTEIHIFTRTQQKTKQQFSYKKGPKIFQLKFKTNGPHLSKPPTVELAILFFLANTYVTLMKKSNVRSANF